MKDEALDPIKFAEHLRRKATQADDIGDSADFVDAADRITADAQRIAELEAACREAREALGGSGLHATEALRMIEAALTPPEDQPDAR